MVKFFRYAKDILWLDIFNLNYYLSTESCGFIKNNTAILPRKGLFVRAIAYLTHFFQEISRSLFLKKLPPNSVLFFVATKNQKDSLSYISELTDGSVVAGEKCQLAYYFPLFWAYLLSPIFFPCLFFRYLSANEYQKNSFKYFADIYLLTYGYYVLAGFWLYFSKIKSVVVANDHIMQTRIMVRLAKEIKIPTIYIQHASVTDKFPPLNFDYALLEGSDAFKKYAKIGTGDTKIYFIGMPKSDMFAKSVNKNSYVKNIGLCCNMFDELAQVEALCALMVKQFPNINIKIRPHPSDKRRFQAWKNMVNRYGLSYSDPTSEKAFEFLSSNDSVIAGESNIHLEAALLNVYPLYFTYSGEMVDWYGFAKNGVVEYFSNVDSLFKKIASLQKEKPSVRSRCKLYCYTIGTAYDWQAGLITKSLIEQISYGMTSGDILWVPYGNSELCVFQPQ